MKRVVVEFSLAKLAFSLLHCYSIDCADHFEKIGNCHLLDINVYKRHH